MKVGTKLRSATGTTEVVITRAPAGEIVRSWPMRGTLHFVPPADLGWMLEITTHRMITGLALRHRQLALESHDFGRARAALFSADRMAARVVAAWEDLVQERSLRGSRALS